MQKLLFVLLTSLLQVSWLAFGLLGGWQSLDYVWLAIGATLCYFGLGAMYIRAVRQRYDIQQRLVPAERLTQVLTPGGQVSVYLVLLGTTGLLAFGAGLRAYQGDRLDAVMLGGGAALFGGLGVYSYSSVRYSLCRWVELETEETTFDGR